MVIESILTFVTKPIGGGSGVRTFLKLINKFIELLIRLVIVFGMEFMKQSLLEVKRYCLLRINYDIECDKVSKFRIC